MTHRYTGDKCGACPGPLRPDLRSPEVAICFAFMALSLAGYVAVVLVTR